MQVINKKSIRISTYWQLLGAQTRKIQPTETDERIEHVSVVATVYRGFSAVFATSFHWNGALRNDC